MTTDEAKRNISEDPDFVYIKRYGFSLKKLLERYPDGCPDHVIAQALLITEDEVTLEYERIVKKIQSLLGDR